MSDNGAILILSWQNDKIGIVLYDSPWIFKGCKSKKGLMAMETIHRIWQSDSDTSIHMAVRVIRARNTDPVVTMPTQVTKAAAYCRVSTDSEEQESSYGAAHLQAVP